MPYEATKVVIIPCYQDTGISIADWVNIIFGVLNLGFVVFNLRAVKIIFDHQKKKEKHDHKINWLKELIIIPNINKIYSHFEKVEAIGQEIKFPNLQMYAKQNIDKKIKVELAYFSRACISLFYSTNSNLGGDIQKISDDFLEEIQKQIYFATVDLSDENLFNAHVGELITKYKRDILAGIHKYEGD